MGLVIVITISVIVAVAVALPLASVAAIAVLAIIIAGAIVSILVFFRHYLLWVRVFEPRVTSGLGGSLLRRV